MVPQRALKAARTLKQCLCHFSASSSYHQPHQRSEWGGDRYVTKVGEASAGVGGGSPTLRDNTPSPVTVLNRKPIVLIIPES